MQTIDGYKGRLNKILTNTTTNVLPNIINLVEDMDDSLIIWRAEMTSAVTSAVKAGCIIMYAWTDGVTNERNEQGANVESAGVWTCRRTNV